jgi:hypothetical protein
MDEPVADGVGERGVGQGVVPVCRVELAGNDRRSHPVGTLRRELLDHVVVLGERHLLRLVRRHAAYYNEDRPHMALDGDAPVTRAVEPRELGNVVALPRVSGLHHRYVRRAA